MVERELANEILRVMQEVSVGVAGLRVEFTEHKEKTNSDIRELKRKQEKLEEKTGGAVSLIDARELTNARSDAERLRSWFKAIGLIAVSSGAGAVIHALTNHAK